MINLRYHIVSITAVFLALGIGITMGSTFLGRGALERIDQNVKNAQEQVRRTNKENADLKREAELEARPRRRLHVRGHAADVRRRPRGASPPSCWPHPASTRTAWTP